MSGSWSIVVGIVVIALCANAALACKITFTGENKEVALQVVKGRSKGVYGASRPFQLTG